jgi:hypothetical protein
VPRAREVVLRLRVLLRAGFVAAPLDAPLARDVDVLRAALARDVDVLRAPLARAEPDVDAFARVEVLRLVVARLAVERFALDLRAPLVRDDRADVDLAPPLLGPSSAVHLPDMTRCAASATASAISEPNLVALDIMLVAACDAVSAASRPASRIARRAFGLALIAAAAAASPAASISLLIAALAILSTVSDELLLEDFAIASSLRLRKRHFKPVTVPE